VEKNEGRDSLAYASILARMTTVDTNAAGQREAIGPLSKALEKYSSTSPTLNLSISLCHARILMEQKRMEEAEPLLLDLRRDLANAGGADVFSTSAPVSAWAIFASGRTLFRVTRALSRMASLPRSGRGQHPCNSGERIGQHRREPDENGPL